VASTGGRLKLFHLPGYSPELNPGQWVWKNVKNDRIARAGITSKDGLKAKATGALRRLQKLPALVRGFFAGRTCATSPQWPRPESHSSRLLTYDLLSNGTSLQHVAALASQSSSRRGRAVPDTDRGRDSFSEFVAGALPGLLRFGHVLTGSPQEAEELVQDALARCLRRWRRVRPDDPVAYARRVMVNSQVTGWHRWGARVQLRDVPEAAAEDAELVRREEWDALRQPG
jgi:hypothetical protein